MGHQPKISTPHNFGGRREKLRAKHRNQKKKIQKDKFSDEDQLLTLYETVDKTIKELQILGSQKFALQPYSQNYDIWLQSLENILFEFESNKKIIMDDQYISKCSQILSEVEFRLKEEKEKEILGEKYLQNFASSKRILEEIDKEYLTKIREFEYSKKTNSEPNIINPDNSKDKSDDIVGWKIKIFRSLSKSFKPKNKGVSNQNLDFQKKDIEVIDSSEEKEKLRDEYNRRKKLVLEEIKTYQNEIENLGIGLQVDKSLEFRKLTCETIADSIKRLVKRM